MPRHANWLRDETTLSTVAPAAAQSTSCCRMNSSTSISLWRMVLGCTAIFLMTTFLILTALPYGVRLLFRVIRSMNEVSIGKGSKTSGRILVQMQSSLGKYEMGTNLQCCRDVFFVGDQAAIWQRLLTCSLLPLRHCLDTVRREFARLCCSLMEEYLDPDLLEHLAGIAQEVRIE